MSQRDQLAPASDAPHNEPVIWGKLIDHRKCIGCHACTVACKAEHSVPLGVTRTYVKQVETGRFPHVQRHFQITRCNQCDNPPCVYICPTGAMFRRHDGIVDFDRSVCIGCKACMAACPYDAIYIDPVSNSAEKCNFCSHRLDVGLEPACVVVCPVEAIVVGPLNRSDGQLRRSIDCGKVVVRKPEKGTQPKLFYMDAHETTLSPMAAYQPALYAWAQGNHLSAASMTAISKGGQGSTQAGDPMLAMAIYDIPKKPPWGWMVSAYLWTKSLASGTFLVPFILMAMGFQWSLEHLRALSLVALAWLLVTGLLLVADLTHPERFYLILIRPQWRSWLARGALVITGFGALLALFAATTYWTWLGLGNALAGATAMLALFTAVYTGFLFAQARARDLWQSPLLPLHLAVQALVAGSAAVILILAIWPFGEEVLLLVGYFLGGSALVHLILAVSEAFFPHPTSEGTESARAMHTGPFKRVFLLGLALSGGVPLTATYSSQLAIAASFAALIGLALYEHAYVQAGQSVPLR